jgi:hypothetical protein
MAALEANIIGCVVIMFCVWIAPYYVLLCMDCWPLFNIMLVVNCITRFWSERIFFMTMQEMMITATTMNKLDTMGTIMIVSRAALSPSPDLSRLPSGFYSSSLGS